MGQRKKRRKRHRIIDLTKARKLSVRRCEAKLIPKGRTVAQKAGLSYERHVHTELSRLASVLGAQLEHNPWFTYDTGEGEYGYVVPDFILSLGLHLLLIEVKYTFVSEAIEKLHKTYVPVVAAGLCSTPGTKISTLVIAKSLTPETSFRVSRLSAAIDVKYTPTLQWLGHGQIQW